MITKKGDFMQLGINIDHIAVLREARRVNDPVLLKAAFIAARLGDSVVIHVREDARHTNEYDLDTLSKHLDAPINLECSLDMMHLASKYLPSRVTLVPEKRAELTTEGGLVLDACVEEGVKKLASLGIKSSLFINPDEKDVEKAARMGADWIELHTGHYANLYNFAKSNLAKTPHLIKEYCLPRNELLRLKDEELKRIKKACSLAKSLGLSVAAGHGLNYKNVKAIALIDDIKELNIGQSIIAASVFCGLEEAILRMRRIISRN